MQFERASLEIVGPVAVLRMDDPDVLNALSPGMIGGMTEALDTLAAAATPARCLVLTGTGRAFSTGANLQGRGKDGITRGAGQTLETVFHPFIRRLRDLPCPIVTAVNGPAAGAGMSLALMGDLILCARSAYFLQAFRRIGLVPDCGSTWLLPRLIGRARAIELSLLGERLPGRRRLAGDLSIACTTTRRCRAKRYASRTSLPTDLPSRFPPSAGSIGKARKIPTSSSSIWSAACSATQAPRKISAKASRLFWKSARPGSSASNRKDRSVAAAPTCCRFVTIPLPVRERTAMRAGKQCGSTGSSGPIRWPSGGAFSSW
jgi:enoyl-CoA hydratase/carnithine racemase